MNPSRKTRARARRFERLTEAQAALGWTVILFLAALLGSIYLTQASRTAEVGRFVQDLQKTLDETKRVNAALEREIATSQSLVQVQARALEMGFRPSTPEDIEYLVIPDYPALPPNIEAATSAAADLTSIPGTMTEALWLSFRQHISDLIKGEASG